MTFLHKIKFLMAKFKGDVVEHKDVTQWQEEVLKEKKKILKTPDTSLKSFIKMRKRDLETLIETEEDPQKREAIDLEYQQLEEMEKYGTKQKLT